MVVAVEKLLTADILRPPCYLGSFGSSTQILGYGNVQRVLTYSEVYEVRASNLGHIILYNIWNDQPRQLCWMTGDF